LVLGSYFAVGESLPPWDKLTLLSDKCSTVQFREQKPLLGELRRPGVPPPTP
jgi:hypothetical protein